MNTESVKINSTILNKVRRHVKKSKQSIGGFFELAAKEKLDSETNDKQWIDLLSKKMTKEEIIAPPQKVTIK